MFWYKTWLDTRLRFLIGLLLLTVAASGVVLSHPKAMRVAEAAGPDAANTVGALTGVPGARERIAEALTLASTYRGYIWSQWFRQEAVQLWCLFAIVLGSGGIVSQAARGGGFFTLSLPISRERLAITRAGTALSELLILAVVPALMLPLVSPAVHQSYSLADAVVHATCLFLGGSIFFAVPFLLSSFTASVWLPPLAMLGTAVVIDVLRVVYPGLTRYTLAPIVSAEGYFRGTGLPWLGLAIVPSLSAVLIYLAVRNVARRDF